MARDPWKACSRESARACSRCRASRIAHFQWGRTRAFPIVAGGIARPRNAASSMNLEILLSVDGYAAIRRLVLFTPRFALFLAARATGTTGRLCSYAIHRGLIICAIEASTRLSFYLHRQCSSISIRCLLSSIRRRFIIPAARRNAATRSGS